MASIDQKIKVQDTIMKESNSNNVDCDGTELLDQFLGACSNSDEQYWIE